MENDSYGPQVSLPNSTVILVLGIASIVVCCCYGIPGLICGIIAFTLSGSAAKLYKSSPDNYTENSYKNVNAGRICAIIGIVLSILYIVTLIWAVIFIGWETLRDPAALQEWLQHYQNI
jgi:hypothetical protein